MDALALVASLAVPWLAGTAALVALRERSRSLDTGGETAWLLGAGYLVGAFALTLWMRALSLAGIAFGRATIALPLVALAGVAAWFAWRREGRALLDAPRRAFAAAVASPGTGRALRVVAWAMLAWLAVRFALVGFEALQRPLFAWDAWTEVGTKARVWLEFGRVVPFVEGNAWLAGASATSFQDALPSFPPTLPLLQVWTAVCLGRWDDALMNLPWPLFAVALAGATYGGLRRLDAPRAYALAGTFIVSTIPLANTHAALPGYGDLPLAAYYTVAVLALLRWCATRERSEAALAAVLALACTQLRAPGLAWALTLVPGVVVALLPRGGLRYLGIGAAALLLLAAALTRTNPVLAGIPLHLEYDGSLATLAEQSFLLGNFNLLWFGAIGAAILGSRRLVAGARAPLVAIAGAAALVLLALFAYGGLRLALADLTPTSRLLLQIAPLAAVFTVLAFREFVTGTAPGA